MGVVATSTPEPPSLGAVRCVPKSWVVPCSVASKVWDNTGLGGQPGALWTIRDGEASGMRLMAARADLVDLDDGKQLKFATEFSLGQGA